MTSSTSSSRRVHALTLLAVLGGMAVCLIVLRGFLEVMDASAESILDREMQALQAMPLILDEPGDLVMVFGSSMTEAAFSARRFDRALAARGVEITSFNFGFGGLNPYFQDYFSRRIRDRFVAEDRRLRLAAIEFTPLQNTKARWHRALPTVDSYVTMLASPREIWELTCEDPTRGVRLANIRYLRNDISAEMTTWFFGAEWFGSGRPESDIPQDQEAIATLERVGPLLTEAFEREYPNYVDSEWSWEWQGAGTIPEERSPQTLALFEQYYAALRTDKRLTEDELWRIECCDYEKLDFEEELIAGFIRTVRNFQEFSDHVEIFLMPVNENWLDRPADAERRLRQVLERIELETGARVRNFERTPEITPEMFSDTTHLARYTGDVAFTDLLVRNYAPILLP